MLSSREIVAVLALLTAAGCTGEQQGQGNTTVEFRVLAQERGETRNLEVGQKPEYDSDKYEWLELHANGQSDSALVKEKDSRKYVLVQTVDEYNVSGKDIADVGPQTDLQGRHAIALEFKPAAKERIENLSSRHKAAGNGGDDPRALAIVIDGKVFRTYQILDTMSDTIQISGGFTERERDDMIATLEAAMER